MNPENSRLIRCVRNLSPDTSRGMGNKEVDRSDYPGILGFASKAEMYKWLEGKKVLDIGSGMGFFALDVMKEKGEDFSYIVSLNPHLKDKGFVND